MRKCTAPFFHVLLLSVAAATNLRHVNPGMSAGIGGSPVEADSSSSDRRDPSNYREKMPEYILTLQNYKGVQYFAPITLNDQTMSAVYDTGSFEVMAMSNMCTACRVPSPLIKYDNRSSKTFVKGGHSVEDHHFAGGLVVARQDFETLHIGDLGKEFIVKDMPFWQVVHTEMPVWKSNKAQFTAIVGLGPRTVVPDTPMDQKPVDTLLERTNIDRFAICLQRGPSRPGYITFNPHLDTPSTPQLDAASRSQPTTSMFRRVPVTGKNHWALELNEVSFITGGHTESLCQAGQACVAIIDSGTSLIGVPPMAVPMVQKIIKEIKPDCSNLHEMQDLVFVLGGHKFVLPPSAYVVQFRTTPDLPRKCLPAFTDFDMGSAHGAVWILGMPFLRQFYTVFDRTEPSIYVADQGDHCQPVANNATTNTTFFNTSFTTQNRLHQEPAFADTSEATLPSWAYGKSMMDV